MEIDEQKIRVWIKRLDAGEPYLSVEERMWREEVKQELLDDQI